MRKLLATVAFLLLLAPRVWANCTITGTVFNPDGSPLVNGTVQFNSVVQQTLQGGAVIPPTQVSTPTNASGVMAPISLVPGLQGQFVFCSPAAGGCGNPTPVLIPIATTADISAVLIGIQLQTGANVNASNLNVSGNTTMGGTLVVGGATTLTSTLNVSGNTSVGGSLTVTGATQLGAPITLTAPITVAGNGNVMMFSGGMLLSIPNDGPGNPSNMVLTSGTHPQSSGSNLWIADSPYAEFITLYDGNIGEFFGSGLTVGQPWYPNNDGSPGRSQYLSVTSAAMTLETGNLLVDNGQISTTQNQNSVTFVSTNNNAAGVGTAAVLRANNGTHVADLGMSGTSANLGGNFINDRGYVASNGAGGLLIEATGAGAGAALFLAAPNANLVSIINGAHLSTTATGFAHPTASGCGAGGSGVAPYSTDNNGYVNTGATQTCTVTFAAGFTGGTPACVCSTQANTSCSILANANGFGLAFGTPLPVNSWVSYICMGEGP
jgi:hypothetical protein